MSLYGHWCDHCGGWFDLQHYDRGQDLAPHMAGAEYGDYGRLLAIEQAARALVAHLNQLVDGEGNWSSAESFWTLEDLVDYKA